MTRAVRRLAVAVLAGCTATLTACGSDFSPDVHPGSAAVVGDERIPLDTVDDFADDLCDWQESSEVPQAQAAPMAFMRAVTVEHLVNNEVLEQYTEEHELEVERLSESLATRAGVETVQEYRQLVEAEAENEAASEDAVEAAIDFFMSEAISNATFLAAGQADDPTLADEEAVARGQELIQDWREEQDIELDPRFGTRATDVLGYEPPEDSLSVLAGERPSSESFFEPAYVDSLPDSQRCGEPSTEAPNPLAP